MRGLFWVALIWLVKAAQSLLLPIVIAVVLTFVLATPVRWLKRRGVPEAAGAALLVFALLGGVALLGSMLVQPAQDWLERAPTTLSQLVVQIDRLRSTIPLLAAPPQPGPAASAPTPGGLSARAAARRALPAPDAAASAAPPRDPLKERIASEGFALTSAVLGRSVTISITSAAVVILLYFLLASEHWMVSRTVQAIRRQRMRALVLAGVRSAQREIGRYLGALAAVNLGVGVVTTAALSALGMPSPVLWGTVAAVLSFIPYLGPLMTMGLLLVAGLVAFESAGQMVAPAGAYLLVHLIESNLVTPWFVGRRLSLSPVAVFLAVMFWGWMWGIAGALIAVPLLIALRVVCKRVRRLRLIAVYLEGSEVNLPSLRSLLRVKQRPHWLSRGFQRPEAATPPGVPPTGELPAQPAAVVTPASPTLPPRQ